MSDAAKIRDVAARHAYVFDNGLVDAGLFDLERRVQSEEFKLLLEHIDPQDMTLEIGCFTGLNLLGLAQRGYSSLTGIEFVPGAVNWLRTQRHKLGLRKNINILMGDFNTLGLHRHWQAMILYDVLEHQLDVGRFLRRVANRMRAYGEAFVLVPEGKNYYDCGHVAFFPDEECLRNVLDYFLDVLEIRRLESGKIWARCRNRP